MALLHSGLGRVAKNIPILRKWAVTPVFHQTRVQSVSDPPRQRTFHSSLYASTSTDFPACISSISATGKPILRFCAVNAAWFPITTSHKLVSDHRCKLSSFRWWMWRRVLSARSTSACTAKVKHNSEVMKGKIAFQSEKGALINQMCPSQIVWFVYFLWTVFVSRLHIQ